MFDVSTGKHRTKVMLTRNFNMCCTSFVAVRHRMRACRLANACVQVCVCGLACVLGLPAFMIACLPPGLLACTLARLLARSLA